MKLHWLSAPVALVLVTTLQTVPSNAAVVKDFTVPATYVLTKCISATELDCIESVGILDSQGVLLPGTLKSETVSETPRISSGNSIYTGNSIWLVGDKEVNLAGTIDSPNSKGCSGTCAALRIFIDVADPLTTKVKLVFRTSWLRPMNIQFKAQQSEYKFEKIAGGSIWTFEGMGMPFSDYRWSSVDELNAKKKADAKADVDSTLFDLFIHHAGKSLVDSYWDPKCSDKGFSVQSHNTNETGDPIWDSANESLIFSIFAPHFRKSGELNSGYFKYWASHDFMDCKYPGNTLTKAAKLTLEIVNEDGTSNVATTAVMNKDGSLNFFASGFHFSAPKILIKADKSVQAATPSPTPSPSASATAATLVNPPKLISISCVKGKITKKVTGLKPKCPAGYKKK
jgi:hypothetical protein